MNEEQREMVCISCPNGCRMTVSMRDGQISVSGNDCPRGIIYARGEFTNPVRMVTGSVWVDDGDQPLVSVKTSVPVAKDQIFHVLACIANLRVNAPVCVGQVILTGVAGTGANLVATREVNKAELGVEIQTPLS